MDEANELVLQHLRTLRVPEELAQQLREALKRAKYESLPEEVACSSSLVRLLAQAQAERSETQSLGGLTADDCSGEGGGVGAVPNGGFSTVAIPWPEGPLVQADPVTRTGGSWPQEVCSFGWPVAVTLHVYDLGPVSRWLVNPWAMHLGDNGVFHVGLEVLNTEWCFEERGGVGRHAAARHPRHPYRESVPLGESPLCPKQIMQVMLDLRKAWPPGSYHFLQRNCVDFAERLHAELRLPEPFPAWVRGCSKGVLQHTPLASLKCSSTDLEF
mmetsp:Transcript_55357/g.171762  ORF Transcript_55357/g.171762 Transcript_55357/m.171762 type:complete len:271 (-) Transcript_55357:53-865(-)